MYPKVDTLPDVEFEHRDVAFEQVLSDANIERVILWTLAYADVFDYPLSFEQLHRYLIGMKVSSQQLQAVLSSGDIPNHKVSNISGFYTLPGRENIVEIRKQRAKYSAHLWTKASTYGQLIARLPFVRMVAVTGALAMDNAQPGDDIDYLIVTAPGRLWLCRAIVIALVRWAVRRGDIICPNYFLSERGLVFLQQSLYTAHELVQMVPLSGQGVYDRIRQLNTWSIRFLPNAEGPPARAHSSWGTHSLQPLFTLAEWALQSPFGSWFENWEMERKVQKFQGQVNEGAEVSFCADWCKGHFDGHGEETMRAFTARMKEFGIPGNFSIHQE
jgi:hypothetical protein